MVSAFEALGLPDVPTVDELVREGFPDDLLRVPDLMSLPGVEQMRPRSMPSSWWRRRWLRVPQGPPCPHPLLQRPGNRRNVADEGHRHGSRCES
ncbi:hypothetical protein GS885_25870 [Rhodococcus hoagii]|nr:hypothetical protein [Prescottella equi]